MSEPSEYTYLLRTCSDGMSGLEGFIWPKSGIVEGDKLYGWLHGHGDVSVRLGWCPMPVYLVLRVERRLLRLHSLSHGGQAYTFSRCEVVFCGDRTAATRRILELDPEAQPHLVPQLR